MINNITSSWYNLHVEKASEIKSEVLLGINLASNAWFLLENLDPDDKCHIMNICELGFNGSVWGEMSELVTEFSGEELVTVSDSTLRCQDCPVYDSRMI